MKVLKVIHGYPMRYNAGSEVYSQTLCQELANRHEVYVFTREENTFLPDFNLRVEKDPADARITTYLINNPRLRDRYRVEDIDRQFATTIDHLLPDIIHVGHLNHLSTSMLFAAVVRKIPIVYTLHDYWLMCPRGQFIQTIPEDNTDLWAVCSGQEDKKCAEHCYSKYNSGAVAEHSHDTSYWTDWVNRRMQHVREIVELVDHFIAPSNYLFNRYHRDFGIPVSKMSMVDYGFSTKRLQKRKRTKSEPFTFGYIGTHIPAKGIHHLITAFSMLEGDALLRIWGRHTGQDTNALKAIASALPGDTSSKIQWLPEYKNQSIIRDVFNHCDAIVVPSIWVENSPLVIHEAQQARVPVITANIGGMAEYVKHEVNGLLFEHRSIQSMAEQMARLVNNPSLAKELGNHGYLFSESGDIISAEEHAKKIESIYSAILNRMESTKINKQAGPWRITFDTNPDLCNLKCIMCEEHSPHSPLQVIRIAEDRPRRVMPYEIIKKVVEESVSKGLKEIIPSTMGEPLLYDEFEKIIGLCTDHNVQMNLTTNGTFPRLGAKTWAEKIVPITSDVKISWNGASKETQEAIMLGANWEKVLNNVKSFIEVRDQHVACGGNRCRVTFQLTFMEDNVDEIADIVQMAIDLGVDRVKGHHLWAHFKEIENQSMRRSAAAVKRWNIAVQRAQNIAEKQRLPNGNSILLENIFQLDETAISDIAPGGPCPFLGKEAWISAEGRFNPCCAPDIERQTLGEFGNLNTQSFGEIWNGEKYQALTENYRNRHLCVGCNMRKSSTVK